MNKFVILAGVSNNAEKTKEIAEKIKALGYNAEIIKLSDQIHGVKVIETEDEKEARAIRDKINKELGRNTCLKIKN